MLVWSVCLRLFPLSQNTAKAPKAVRQPSTDDETTFSGVNRPSDIPSKAFRHLQNMTVRGAQGEVDNTPIRANVSGGTCIFSSTRYNGVVVLGHGVGRWVGWGGVGSFTTRRQHARVLKTEEQNHDMRVPPEIY